MCAPGNGSIRLRLFFDYPPPAVVSCRKCWLLVDLSTCRVVADLESVIRDKFEFSRGSILSLFIEDCYLPHTESIHVVRDNDSVRVKVDSLTNGHSSCPETTRETCRKRPRTTEEDGPAENGVEWKKKKRKKRSEETTEEAKKLVSDDDGEKELQTKHAEKKKKKKKVEKVSPTVKPAASPKKTPTSISKPAKSSKKPPAAKPQKPSSDSSSSSEEDEPPRNTKPASSSTAAKPTSSSTAAKTPPNSRPVQKKPRPPPSSSSDSSSSSEEDEPPRNTKTPSSIPTAKTSSSSTATKPASSIPTAKPSSSSTATKPASSSSTATKTPPNSRPVQKKPRPPPSSSSESDSSSSDEDPEVKTKPLPALTSRSQPAPPVLESTSCEQKAAGGAPQDSDGEEDIQLVIRRPLLPAGFGVGSPGRGRGRGQGRRGGGGERGRRGGGIRGSFRATETSYETDVLSNVSVVLQNGVQDAPKRDYSSLPLLAAPPALGQNIAFKLLELTENYTPEVSEYKEGKIVSFDPTTKQIELELLNSSQAPVEPGKFDLVYQNPDGSESVEYAVSRGSWVTERWESLLEPRLII